MHKLKKILRTSFVTFCIVAVVAAFAYIFFLFSTTPHQIKVIDFDAYRVEALKAHREEAGGYFQIAIAVFGALWATMIVSKEHRLRPEDIGDISMFVAATTLLVGFLWFNWQYARLLGQLYWDMGPLLSPQSKFADILNSRYVVVHYLAVEICFYGGLLLSAICTFSSCMLRSKT
ncbi:MAG: hypothetical protein WA192_00660 [Candidatus Acidiferrales bacterium]